MVLNIFPRRKDAADEAATPPQQALPEPSAEALATPPRRTIRRVPREEAAATLGAGESAEAPVKAPRARRAAKPKVEAAPAAEETPAAAEGAIEPVMAEAIADAPDATAGDAESGDRPAGRRRRRGRGGRGSGAGAEGAETEGEAPAAAIDGTSAGIVRALERQNRQIEQLIKLQEEMARRGGIGGAAAAPPARVGVFVDVANVELASDRLRARFDWKKILDMLTKDRTLVRAMAYSPVHDDPGVSIETQRFVEPFLDKGYKIVTKPLKRFQDGSVKANVDIELALDVIEMLDRMDVVCLVSGDGDFQRLVEVVQSKGVRVEVVSVGMSTASNLRHAADQFIDLQARLRDVRL